MTTTDEKLYISDVTQLANALRVALTLLSMVDNKRLGELDKTIETADNLAMLLVAPIELPRANKSLEVQRHLIQWVKDTRQCLRDIIDMGVTELIDWKEEEDTPSMDWLLGESIDDGTQ